MAVCNCNEDSNAEMDPELNNTSVHFSDFVSQCSFPQCVCVTEGSYLSSKVQISRGDVLFLKSCDNTQVILSFRLDNSCEWTDLNVSYLDYCGKFKVLPPKDFSDSDRAVSMITYPTVSDLLLDCPTYFEATSSYDDPYLPGMSVKAGDRFWFIETVTSNKDRVTRLKVRDHLDNIMFLSPDCRGNFCPLKDNNVYTLKELIDLAQVQRSLIMVKTKQGSGSQTKCEDLELSNNRFTTENISITKTSRPTLLWPPITSQNVNTDHASLVSLNLPPSCIIHMKKPESIITVSPYNDMETTWAIPECANIKVRPYSHSEYEVPVRGSQFAQSRVPLPISPIYELPKFPAPGVPSLPQPLVPMHLFNFVNIYCSSFPVKAKILSTDGAHSFIQNSLRNVEEVYVHRLCEVDRLYVKDARNDIVYSLSSDLKLSFIEYPEKFTRISQLLHLPVGSEVTVLDDISADYPKPFSLRLGDIIRLTSKSTYLIKTAIPQSDCRIIKCERIDPEGAISAKLRLPLDFEVNMVMTTNPSSKKLLHLQDVLSGSVCIPKQAVASVPEDGEDQELKDLPVNLQILSSMSEKCVIISSSASSQLTSEITDTISNNESSVIQNICVPLISGIVLSFTNRLAVSEKSLQNSVKHYKQLPVGKMTIEEFEDLRKQLKPVSDYEHIDGTPLQDSKMTDKPNGTDRKGITRTHSNGVFENKSKNTKMDKVRRLSRVLNPKHWHHPKPEPVPLPHPSTMGLSSLGTRPKDGTNNEYQEEKVDCISVNSGSTKSGSTTMDISTASDEAEDENIYEDVDICRVKSTTTNTNTLCHEDLDESNVKSTTTPTNTLRHEDVDKGLTKSTTIIYNTTRQTGPFSGPAHKSLPMTHSHQKKSAQQYHTPDTEAINSSYLRTDGSIVSSNVTQKTDIPKPFVRAKNWASNLGSNLSGKFNLKLREDATKDRKFFHDSTNVSDEISSINESSLTFIHENIKPPDFKPPLPPQKKDIKLQTFDENKVVEIPPVPQARQRKIKPESVKNTQNERNRMEDSDSTDHKIYTTTAISPTNNESIKTSKVSIELPKPKPRGLKNHIEKDQHIAPLPISQQGIAAPDNPITIVNKCTSSHLSPQDTSSLINSKSKSRPKPPPKPKIAANTTV